jgi:hypothetical protein
VQMVKLVIPMTAETTRVQRVQPTFHAWKAVESQAGKSQVHKLDPELTGEKTTCCPTPNFALEAHVSSLPVSVVPW